MSNNLKKMEKDLRAFAKRSKDVKYTKGLLFSFLLMGMLTFSDTLTSPEVKSTENAINQTRKELNTSINDLHVAFRQAKRENNRLLKNANLELIQLMEQGDQVVKSPWSSWQMGMNFFYNNWRGTYKGHGDKQPDQIFKRDTTLARFQKNLSNGKYGTTDLDLVDEPLAEISVSAGVRPKIINKQLPNLQLPRVNAPNSPALNITLASPEPITPPTITPPNINPEIVSPNAEPFSDFMWGWLYEKPGYLPSWAAQSNLESDSGANFSFGDNIDISGGTFWSGVDENGNLGNVAGYKDATQDTTKWNAANFITNKVFDRRHQSMFNSYNGRWTGLPGNTISGGTFHVAGGEKDTSIVPSAAATGTEVFHLVSDVHIKNVTANLYGKAAFINAEAFRGGQTTMENVKINVKGDNNTIFNIKGFSDTQDNPGFAGSQYSTLFSGSADITVDTKNNTAYAVSRFAGGLRIDNSGDIQFNGASNIGFSFLTWVPDKSKYIATTRPNFGNGGGDGEGSLDKYIPYVKLSANKPMKMYGDENVGMFFNTLTPGVLPDSGNYNIGIHQGKFELYFNIGEKLSSDGAATQKASGQLTKNGYSPTTVDGNVGVYAISGQRDGVDVSSLTNTTTYPFYNQDPIHDLRMDKFKISFGKYSKNGFMFLAKNGTVIDIQDEASQPNFSDGINDENTTEADAATGTIVAYAEGKWTAAGTKMTGAGLEGKATEIKVNKKLNMMSKKGVAFYAKDGGKITVNKDAEGHGYGSIMAYADNGSEVTVAGNVKAVDSKVTTAKEKFTNIGAYAKKGSKVSIAGNTEINGLGALAEGAGSEITLGGANNRINSGTEGALFSKNGGVINFGGGTIVNKDNSADKGLTENDHKKVTPFYVEGNGKITFNGATKLDMYDGALVFGGDSDYSAAVGGAAKYQGMSNVTVELKKDGINLGVFKGLKGATNVTWSGNSGVATYLNALKAIPKFAAINDNGHSFKSTLLEGTMTVDADVNLSDPADKFNDIIMEREVVTINPGKKVTGNGKGLSMGSNAGAASSLESGFVNKGDVNITGGTAAAGVAGINVSYGHIVNDSTGKVTVDNGAALFGTNGSTLENRGTLNITGSGTGIAGLGKASSSPVTYGNGSIEIINAGAINIAGPNSTGIYAENNNGAAHSDVSIINTSALSLGDNSTGIALKGGAGGRINVSGTGNSDIKVGRSGVGIYGENTDVTLTTPYGIETGDGGVGIFTAGTSTVTGSALNYKYSGTPAGSGIAALYAGANATNNLKVNLTNATNTTGGIVGLFANGGGTFTNTGDVTGSSQGAEFGIVADNNTNVTNSGNITLGNAADLTKGNAGIFSKTPNTITNSGNVTVGHNSIGVYGYALNSTRNITGGDNSIGVYSQGGNVNLTSGTIKVGAKEAVGVFTSGANQNIVSNNAMVIGDSSYGFVIKGAGTNLTTNNAGGVTLGNNSIFAYSDVAGNMTNHTKLTSTGRENYGLYSKGNITNLNDIDFASGVGNVGIFSTGGLATNGVRGGAAPRIKVSASDTANQFYGIGMAAGYLDDNGVLRATGNIENHGTIDVLNDHGIGMYAVGRGSTAKNYGTINLGGKGAIGMYLDNHAVGENHGTITTVPNNTKDGIIGVVAANGAIFKNYGQINIVSPEGKGFYSMVGGTYEAHGGNITVGGGAEEKGSAERKDTGKGVKGIQIKAPGGSVTTATVIRNNKIVAPTPVDTNIASPRPTHVTVGNTTLDLSRIYPTYPTNMGRASELGMYVDTSGVNYTKPIQGLQHLTNLKKVNLIFGTEAAKYTNAKDIEIGKNILNPYNEVINQVSTARGGSVKWGITAGSLTWIATVTQNADFTISKLYMSKIPYTSFAKAGDTDNFNFLDGLEQRYGIEALGTREKLLFDKLNDLGKGEGHILAQAVDQMKGHQYANVQQRIVRTEALLDKEFTHLKKEWDNKSKQSNKIKVFGMRDEYNTDSAGIIDYRSNAYGVAYVHEDETIKLGNSSGWYAGAINNRLKFKDIGKSKENTTMVKLGVFKSTAFDHNGSLAWTISGEGYIARSNMHRRFLVVDDIFSAKSDYTSYGVALKNEIGKEFRTSERTSIRPYGSLKLEYGRFNSIRERDGEVRLEVKGNDYYSVKPEVGIEFKYKQPMAVRTTFTAGLGLGYETELGQVGNAKNKARVAYTEADWYNLRGEKEDRRGNFKADLNLGIENQRFGVTLNAGYDTKGKNIRGGLGLRVIY